MNAVGCRTHQANKANHAAPGPWRACRSHAHAHASATAKRGFSTGQGQGRTRTSRVCRVGEGIEDYGFRSENKLNGQFSDVVEEHWFDRLSSFQSARELIQALDKAVEKKGVEAKTEAVKNALVAWTDSGLLPSEFLRNPASKGYGRRALHIDAKGEYSAVVMSWPPGASTAIHDHDDLWCVECVVAGNIVVESYDVKEVRENEYELKMQQLMRTGKGSAGSLIPPFDVHRIGNQGLETAITIHVYGGNLEKCIVFEEQADSNLYSRVIKSLRYTHDMPWYEYNSGSIHTLSRDRTDVEIGGNV